MTDVITRSTAEIVIAIFERLPYWGPELQRQFLDRPVEIRECRSVSDLRHVTNGYSRVLLVIDFAAAPSDCLTWLGTYQQESQPWPLIVCGSPESAELEWRLRDAGVTAFLPDMISGDQFARLCRRLLGLKPQE